MQKILIFSEKPSVYKAILNETVKTWSNADIDLIGALPYTNPVPHYPRGLSFNDYPLIAEPIYKPGEILFSRAKSVNNQAVRIHFDSLDIHAYDEILYAADPDHSGAISFYLIMEHYFGKEIWETRDFQSIRLLALDELSIEKAFKSRKSFAADFQNAISYGLVKRYFDWHWNVNSQVILSETLRRAGVLSSGNPVISKYGVQLLYFIQDHPGLSEGNLFRSMNNWVGTGKYTVSHNFGSVASRYSIVCQLLQLGLICNTADKPSRISIADVGLRFIELLHKDMRDADLPSRLHVWCAEGLEVSRSKIDRYIMTYFGKQKKFMKNRY